MEIPDNIEGLEGLDGGAVGGMFEPGSQYRQMAVSLWNIYKALVQQGFTPMQAMQLTMFIITQRPGS